MARTPSACKHRASKATESASITVESAYNIEGDRRKALVTAVANYTVDQAIYQNAPAFAYHIGSFTVDKTGTFTGPIDQA